jgi:hypothetical protein
MTEATIRRSHVPVVWRQRPFVGTPHRRDFDLSIWSPTIRQIVDSIPESELPRGFAELGEVRINGDVQPREIWHIARPRHRPGFDTVVTLHVPLTGGGGGGSSGGGKNTGALVASIAVLLVAAVVSGGALGALFPSLAGVVGAGTIGASLAGAAIGCGGDLEISALRPVSQCR